MLSSTTTSVKKSIVINTIEVYGRIKSTDSHRESFKNQKGVPPETSLSPSFATKYPNVWPTVIHDKDGKKLVIGTQTFNALITSSLKIDNKLKIESHLDQLYIRSSNESQQIAILLDKESIRKAISLSKDKGCRYIEGLNMLYQLRQVRTKFHLPSTYILCRASGFFVLSHNKQPYTIYTLLDYDKTEQVHRECNICVNYREGGSSVIHVRRDLAV